MVLSVASDIFIPRFLSLLQQLTDWNEERANYFLQLQALRTKDAYQQEFGLFLLRTSEINRSWFHNLFEEHLQIITRKTDSNGALQTAKNVHLNQQLDKWCLWQSFFW